MGNQDLEFQVQLGLAGAQQQVKQLHEALQNSVKIDSNSFKTIFDMLKKAEASVDKLSGRLNTAFQTSAGSKSFLKDYEKMIELLSTAQQKLGTLGFQDIKFSIQDQKAVDESVNRMQELETAIDNIQNQKAITLVNSSSVDGIEKLREYIASLNIDVSKLSFEKLSNSLSDALNEVNTKTTQINEQIANIDKTINGLDASSLKKLEAGINATNGVNIKLLDDKSIDAANEKLREFKKEFSGLSDKAYNSLQVTQSTKDISKFIEDETNIIKTEYQKQIETIRDKKAQINAAMTIVQEGGHAGKTGNQKYYNTEELTNLINSSELIKKIVEDFGASFDQLSISAKISKIKEELRVSLNGLNDQEVNLTALRDKVETHLSAVFDGLSERTVADVKKVKATIEDNLNQFNIKAVDLKAFGFDISSIEKGQSLVTIYNNIAAAIDQYKAKLEETRGSLQNTDLVQLQTQFEQLSAAQQAWQQSQANSGDIIEKLKAEIADLREKLELLAQSYNKEMTPKVNNNNLYQAKNALEEYINSLTKLEGKQKALSNVQMAITRWMGFYQVLNLTKRAIQSMKQHITELDTVMTKIAVVTNMSQNDLWEQIGKYSEIARQYGVAIKGVYEVSQIYYQQGLNKGDVMGLTTETLKMARIAGIDYATAADYMTTAIRGFKLEMTEAAHVTDVFSNLAAHTASSTEELATAISKTAASAANVGASFEATSAMMATMIATTRESATNIGTALKSIISRYGEMKVNPNGTDQEGEEYSLNKVDAALKSIGVSLQDANHQFRDFDDVILELAEKWDSIDKSAQRYIATIMAGNRQQSRFLALVSNVEEYKKALDLANNSENAGELQTLKTLDSIDAKVERMKVTIQEFYTSSGIQDLYKGILDTVTNVISAANNLPKAFGKLPVTAIAIGFSIVSTIKNVLTLIITFIQSKLKVVSTSFDELFANIAKNATNQGKVIGKNLVVAVQDEVNKTTITLNTSGTPITPGAGGLSSKLRSSGVRTGLYLGSTAASLAGTALTLGAMNQYGAAKTEDEVRAAAGLQIGGAAAQTVSGALSGVATGAMLGGQTGGIWGAAIGGIIGAISSGWSAIAAAIQMNTIDTAKKLELAQKKATEKQQKATEAKGKISELQQAYNKLSELEAKQYESVEAMQEYYDYMNQLADTYPYLVDSMTTTGDKIIQTTELELELAKARGQAATQTAAALRAEIRSLEIQKGSYNSFQNQLGLTYTGDKEKFNIAQLVLAVRNRTSSQAVEKGTYDKYLNEIEDPFEFLVKTYSVQKDFNDSFGLLQNGKYKKNIDWKEEFYKHFDEIVNYYSQVEQSISKDYNTSIRKNLVNSLNELKKVNKDEIDFSEILQIEDFTDVNSLLDEKKFSQEKIVELVVKAQKWAQEHIDNLGENIDSINKVAFDTEIESQVLESAKKEGREDLKNFTSIFGSLRNYLGYNFATGKDESEIKQIKQYNEKIRTDVEDWILDNTEAAEKLLALQLNNFSFANADTFANALGIENNEDNKIILDALVDKYNSETAKVRTSFIDTLQKSVFKTGTDTEGKAIFDQEQVNKWTELINGNDGADIPPSLLNILQGQLVQYKALKDKGYTLAAENYLAGLEKIYTLVSASGKIEEAAPVLRDLDLTDIESIDTAITAFWGIEGMEAIVTELNNLRDRVAQDIGITIERILSSASESIEKAEKALDNIGKGMSESDALKTAQEIINNSQDKSRQARSLIHFDNELGQWALLPNTIYEAYQQVIEDSQKEIIDITAILGAFNSELGESISTMHWLGDSDLNEEGLNNTLNGLQQRAIGSGLTPEQANKFAQQVENWRISFIDAKKTNNDLKWKDYIDEQLKSYSELQNVQLATLQSLIDESPLGYLSKVNWESIAGGTATDAEKEYLQVILRIAGATSEQISTIMAEVAQAKYDSLETVLADLGLNFKVGKTTQKKSTEANTQSYLTLYKELMDESTIELSDTAKNAAAELGYSGAFTSDIRNWPTTIALLLQASREKIDEFYNNHQITLEEYNNILSQMAQQANKDDVNAKAVIDMAKDGITQEELAKYATSIGKTLNDYWDEATNQFKDEDLNKVFEYDKETQSMKPKAEASAQQIFAALAKAFGVSLDGFTGAATDTIDQQIAQRAADNQGNKIKNQLSKLASAGVGEEVNISELTSTMKVAIGLDENAETIKIASETERDALILLLESVIANYNGEGKELLQSWYNTTKTSIKNKKPNKYSAFKDILGTEVNKDSAKNYLEASGISTEGRSDLFIRSAMRARGYRWDAYTQTYRATIESLEIINKDIEDAVASGIASPETIAALRKQAADLEQELTHDKKRDALANLLSNYQDAESFLSEFYAQFGEGYSKGELKQKGILTTDEHGKEVIDIDKLNEIVEGYDDLFKTIIEERIDEYISNAEKAGSLFTQGTTSQVEMSAFKEAYKKLTGGDVEFIFDPLLQAWTIDASALKGYLKSAAAKLNLGDNAVKWVEDQLQTLTVDNLDFSNYLSGTASQKDQNKLKHDLQNYFKTHNEDYMPYMGSLEEWAEQRTDNLLATLDKGGQEAVDALKSVKGELTPEEIQNAYRAQVAPIKALYDQIDELQVGSVVAENQINALTKAGFTVNADGVVTVVGNLVEAYKSLYNQMKDTGEATLAEINEALGKYLDNRDGEQQAIDALSNAANMTYSQLAEIYTQAGIELTEELVNAMEEVGIIKGLGGNKLMIQDFRAFAKQMNWGEGSEEYINAFKAYNDSLIEYDRQTEKSIVEEIKNVAAAKPGDKINLTHFVSQLENGLDTILVATGATIQNGILTITEGADLADITNQLLAMVPKSVELIPDEIAEIADAVNAILQQIASLIKEGINGTLSNANKQSLTSWGNANGLNLQFTQTAEGFKLAQSSAIEVYNTLKSIDALQGKLVFDELNKSLQESNEHYKSISDVANRIKAIESIAPDARSKEYAQELALAKEIYAVRSTTEDSSFSFMSNKIPGAQSNPINYFNNWAQAIHTFNDALKTQGTYTKGGETYKSGFVDYDFWYNLVTEMNNIAALGGDIKFAGETLDGTLEAASKLIQKGAESLVVTDTGEVKVALKGMSLDFATGADAFSDNVTEGIQALAKSQSKMLDGLIKLLEAVVAMEKLGDIDVGPNGILDLSELFENKTGEQNWTISEKNLEGFNAFIAKAGDSLDSIIINGQKFTDLAEKAKTEGLDKAMAENFTAIMNSLYQMYKSGDYNLNNLYDSIQQIMAQSKFTGELQLGDTTLHVKNGAIIIETEDEKGKKKFQTPNGETYDTMGEAIARSAVMAQGIKEGITFGKDEKLEQEVAAGTLTIKTLGVDVEVKSDKQGNLTFNDASFDNIDQYIQKLIDEKKLGDTEAAKLKTNVGLEIGTIKLDSFSYKSIDSKIREEFEAKLASGSQVEVDKYISLHPVLKQLEGKTGAEITEMLHLDDVKVIVDNSQATEAIDAVTEALDAIDGRVAITTIVTYKKTVEEGAPAGTTSSGSPSAKKPNFKTNYVVDARGNVGTANAKGTLMGELGPELVVSNGHYFVAGQSGPEMVNLADDAIVFNHLQTESLLKKGMSNGRGKAVTNERNAVSFATGNVNGGPAKASASSALEVLRQLKAQWDALAGLSVRDLARKAGGGGGGGGNNKQFIKDLERWYNWLQEISKLEKKINYEESLRSKMQSDFKRDGREYFDSQMKSLEYLQREIQVQKDLVKEQKAFFEQRREELNSSKNPFSQFWTYDEEGQIKYTDKQFTYNGQTFNGGFEALAEINKTDDYGNQIYNADQQLDMMTAFLGKDVVDKYRKDADGKERESADILEAIWNSAEGNNAEMQGLFDSIRDGENAILDYEQQQNDILHEIEDNQIAVEDKVLNAIEDTRQREIDELQKERDAIEESSENLIDGLSDQLQKERDMYSRQEDAKELSKLQRQLAILQRSGGSASQIATLQNQITDQMQENYFDAQQAQIDALQKSSDNQLERLDHQIDLMTEQLEYEKEHGLLWNQVYEVMSGTPEQITDFITSHDSQYWGESPTKVAQDTRDTLFQAEQFVQFRKKVEGGLDALIAENSDSAVAELADQVTANGNAAAEASAAAAEASAAADTGTGTSTNTTSNTADEKKKSWYVNGKQFAYKKDAEAYLAEQQKKARASQEEAERTAMPRLDPKKYAKIKAQTDKWNKAQLTYYDRGGMVDETGEAVLHAKEGVLTAAQTSVLRNDILGNKPNSLLNLLMDFRDAYERIPSASAYDSIGTSTSGIVIENATVEMNVSKIANDYDAQRAGEQALEKMLQIARKTSAQNRIGR